MTEKQLQEKYLRRYTEIFEKAYKSPALHDLLSHDDEKIGFATPLITNGESMKRDVLFVGINPSFRIKDQNLSHFNALTSNDQEDYFNFKYGLEHYDQPNDGKVDPYFGKVVELAKGGGLCLKECGYLDLFVFRRTQQKHIAKILKYGDCGVQFLVSQLEVFHDIVTELVDPKLIVVVNSQAQNFFGLRVKEYERTKEKVNIWLGYETKDIYRHSPIKEVLAFNPQLSDDFNTRVRSKDLDKKLYIAPFKYLGYLPPREREVFARNIKDFMEENIRRTK